MSPHKLKTSSELAVTLHISIPGDLDKRLRKYCNKKKKGISEVIQDSLEHLLMGPVTKGEKTT